MVQPIPFKQGRKPKLTFADKARLYELRYSDRKDIGELMEMFCVSRATVFNALKQMKKAAGTHDPERPTASPDSGSGGKSVPQPDPKGV